MVDAASYLSVNNTKTQIKEIHIIDSFSKRPSYMIYDWYDILEANSIPFKKFYYSSDGMGEIIENFKQDHSVTDFPVIMILVEESKGTKYTIVMDEENRIATKVNSNNKTVATVELAEDKDMVTLIFEDIDTLLSTDFIEKCRM